MKVIPKKFISIFTFMFLIVFSLITKNVLAQDSKDEKLYLAAKKALNVETDFEEALQVIESAARQGQMGALNFLLRCFNKAHYDRSNNRHAFPASVRYHETRHIKVANPFLENIGRDEHCKKFLPYIKSNNPSYYFDLTFSFLRHNQQPHDYGNIYVFIETFYKVLPYHREGLFIASFLEWKRNPSSAKLASTVMYAIGALARMNHNLFTFKDYSTLDFMSMVETIISAKHDYEGASHKKDFLLGYATRIYYELSNLEAIAPNEQLIFRANAHYHVLKLSQRTLERKVPLPLIIEVADLRVSGDAQNINLAKSFYSLAATKGDVYSAVMLGAIYESEGNYDSAISYYQKAVKNGFTEARESLARAQANRPKPQKAEWKIIRDVMLEDRDIRSALIEHKKVSYYCGEFKRPDIRNEWENTYFCKRYDACMSLAEALIDKKDSDKARMCGAATDIRDSIYAAFSGQTDTNIDYAFSEARSNVSSNHPSFKKAFPYIKVDFNKVGKKMERDEHQAAMQANWGSLMRKIEDIPNAIQRDLNAAERAIERATGVRSAIKPHTSIKNVEQTVANFNSSIRHSNANARVNQLTNLTLTDVSASNSGRTMSLDEITSEFNTASNGIRGTGNLGPSNDIPFTFDDSCYRELEAHRNQCEANYSGFELVGCLNNPNYGAACKAMMQNNPAKKPSKSIAK